MKRSKIDIKIQYVDYMPKELEFGILYVSEEYGTAAHLCPCGCGSKIRTPIGSTEWSVNVTDKGPSLYPSVGNWQLPCKSHYWIRNGQILWASSWTAEQIAAGRLNEEERRHGYYDALGQKQRGLLRNIWAWLKSLIK